MNPNDIKFTQTFHIPLIQYKVEKDAFSSAVHNEMRQALANYIVDKKIETNELANHVEKKLELYVADANTFWSIINKKAYEIAYYMK